MHTSLPDSIDKALRAANFSNRNYIIIHKKISAFCIIHTEEQQSDPIVQL
jgi:hypothetical protein